MENIFYDDRFFSDFGDFVEFIEEEYDCTIEELDEDFSIEIYESELKPILILSIDDINTDSDNFSEDNEDEEFSKIIKVLKENIDFDKINSLMPKNYHRINKPNLLTKQQILEYAA